MITKLYARIRFRLTSMCRVLGSNHTETLGNFVRSIPERWLDSSVKCHVVDMQVIRIADTEPYQYSSNLPPAFRTEMHFARRHVYHLKDVVVHPHTGACSAGGQLFQESYGSLRRCLLEKPFPVSGAEALQLHGLITCIHATGYYHFLLEEIPRLLWAIDRYPDAKVHLADCAPQFCRDILELMVAQGIINEYATLKADLMVKMQDYVFTQAEAYSGFVHSTDIRKLREAFIPHCESMNEAKEKILISRRRSVRAFDNEAELEESFADLGYRVVYLERMTFDDQIKLMQNSETVVASHGAGLANVVWCRPGTKVLEIFSTKYFNDCYARLCSTLNLKYQPMWANETCGWGKVDLDCLIKMIDCL